MYTNAFPVKHIKNITGGVSMNARQYLEQIYVKSEELNALITSYWQQYSHMGTWQFWTVLSLLVVPLILLYFTVDRRRIFEVFFYGYTVHTLWKLIAIVLERYGYLVHKFFLTPILPFAINMTAAVLPVAFLLLYQYCTNKDKNFYVYAIVLSAIFAFGFASFSEYLGLVELRQGMNKFYLFLLDVAVAYIAYWFTKLVLKLKKTKM